MYEIFEKLLKDKGITVYRVAKDTGLNAAMFTSWKKGDYTPKQDKLQKIADYFGVSLDYLMTGKESEPSYYIDEEAAALADFAHKNPEYKVLFDASRKVKPEDIDFVLEMIKRTSNNDD